MPNLGLTLYVLIWPVMAAMVLLVLCVSLFRDLRAAAKSGKDLV